MCGIAGILNLNGESVEQWTLQRMTDAIAHRGPDGEGHFRENGVGLGHRRLAIIDLSDAGRQPMESADGRFVMSYNGEIYNYRELRSELRSLGYQFHSRTDTEVFLYAFAHWREQAFEKFNGMFAVAIWDRLKRSMYLARDRYGIKPLYYTQAGQTVLAASEIKALLTHPTYTPDVDKEALLEYFTFQNLFTDRSLFKGVRILPAGCWMEVSKKDGLQPIQRYWDYHFAEPDEPMDDDECVEELNRLFVQAVQRHLMGDVEIGAYLSGGIDSGAITAVASQHLPNMRSFTGGFDLHSASGLELSFDEREAAEHMSYLFKTEHYEVVLKAGDMERAFPKLAWHLDEPRMGQCYPNHYVAQLASKFVRVVLAGTGGDEMFAGYPWRYYMAEQASNLTQYTDKYYKYWQRLVDNTTLKRMFQPIRNDVAHVWTRDIFKGVFSNYHGSLSRPEDFINHSLYLEAKTFLHGLLIVDDKVSMSHSLETRTPFLDNDLVDFAMRIPAERKLGTLTLEAQANENEIHAKRDARSSGHLGKRILRTVTTQYVPPRISNARKQGFSGPDASWFKGESIEYVQQTLGNKNSMVFDLMDYGAVQELVRDHTQGKTNRRLLIWSLLNLNWWLNTFFR